MTDPAILNPEFLDPPYTPQEGVPQVYSFTDKKGRITYAVMTPKRIYRSSPNNSKRKPGYWKEYSIDWAQAGSLEASREPDGVCAILVGDAKGRQLTRCLFSIDNFPQALTCALDLLAQAWGVEESPQKDVFHAAITWYKDMVLSGQMDHYDGALRFNGIVPYVADSRGNLHPEHAAMDESTSEAAQTVPAPAIDPAILSPQFLRPPYIPHEGVPQAFSATDNKGRTAYTVMTPKRIYAATPNATITGKVKPGYWTEGSVDWSEAGFLKSFRSPDNICAINVGDEKVKKVVKGIVSLDVLPQALNCAMDHLAIAWGMEDSKQKDVFLLVFSWYKDAVLSGQLDNYDGALRFNGIIPYVADFNGNLHPRLAATDE